MAIPDKDLLSRLIKRAEQELVVSKETGAAADDFAVLFTGNWQDAIPRNIILNKTLTPLDKVTWQAIRLSINNPQQPGTMPNRDELAIMVNCSAPTITTARQMLRLCRYMTFCSVVRHQGKFFGEIYLLHDEPLSIAETLELDPTYMDFAESLANSGKKSARLRKEAALVLKECERESSLYIPNIEQRLAKRLADGIDQFPREDAIRPYEHIEVHGRENSEKASSNQSKNFSLDGKSPNASVFCTHSVISGDTDQSKNFTLGEKLIKSHRSKNFTPVFCSSFCSSSINKNIFNTPAHVRTRDNEASKHDDWQKRISHLKKSSYTSERLPEYIDGEPAEQAADHDWQLTENEIATIGTENLDRQLGAAGNAEPHKAKTGSTGYQSIDPDNITMNPSELFTKVQQHLPEIAYPQLARFLNIGFVGYQTHLPYFRRMLSKLNEIERRDILLQYLARKVSYVQGWSTEDVINPPGFLKILMRKMQSGDFIPDSFCCEFISAILENREPVFLDSAGMWAKRQMYEESSH